MSAASGPASSSASPRGVLGGGGGGKDDIAQGGGQDPAKVGEALGAVEWRVGELAG